MFYQCNVTVFVFFFRNSYWHLFKVPLDAKFTETYVSSGIGKSGEDEEKGNIASFVRKTKELLLNEEVLKEVEVSAPGDKVRYPFFT
jgi:hypothetical protein